MADDGNGKVGAATATATSEEQGDTAPDASIADDGGDNTAGTPTITPQGEAEDEADTVPDAKEGRFFGGKTSFFAAGSAPRPTPTNAMDQRWRPTFYSAFSISGLDTPASSVEEKDASVGGSSFVPEGEGSEVQFTGERRPTPLAVAARSPATILARVNPTTESEGEQTTREVYLPVVARGIGDTETLEETSGVDDGSLNLKPTRVTFSDTAPIITRNVSGGSSRAAQGNGMKSRPPPELQGRQAAPVGPMLQPSSNLPEGEE